MAVLRRAAPVSARRETTLARVRRFRLVRQPETGERHAGEADAEFLQRHPTRNGLGQALGEFIELVVHIFPFVFVVCVGLSPYRLAALHQGVRTYPWNLPFMS